MRYYPTASPVVLSPVQPAARSALAVGGVPGDTVTLPDSGYVFVFHVDGRQLYHADGRAVQVAEIYANA
jgi:hypothetical protein